jgi:lysyl-tRNA synthetase class 2
MIRIAKQRLEKLENLRARGVDPFPHRYHRSHTTRQAVAQLEQQEKAGQKDESAVDVAGRVMANRSMGKVSFMDIRDGTGKVQLFLSKELLDKEYLELLKDIDIGDIVGASGGLFRTKSGEPSVAVRKLVMLAKSLQPLPEKWHGLTDVDLRHRQRYIDLIANPEVMSTFQVRSQVVSAVRQFLEKRDFLEVETPVLLPAAGGALARPFVTHHQALDQDFYLRIATELHLKRLIVGGFDKVYEVGRIFRNEGISTQHNPEFTMLESYEAYADYNDVMEMVEQMVSTVTRQVLGTTEVRFGNQTVRLDPPWPRISLRQAIIDHSSIDFEDYQDTDSLRSAMLKLNMDIDPEKDRGKLIDELLSTFVEPNIVQPTFLIDYPLVLSPLAKKKTDNERFVERFEAFVAGMEFANAFTELNDPIDQRQRFLEQQKQRQAGDEEAVAIDEDFIRALEYGMPPTGGLGIGIDRLVMLLTDQHSIREVILFPQLKDKPQGE